MTSPTTIAALLAVYAAGEGERMGEDNEWHPIDTVPVEQQVLIWEPMYGWLIAIFSHIDGWSIKSSGNFWARMPKGVVPEKWQHLPRGPIANAAIEG